MRVLPVYALFAAPLPPLVLALETCAGFSGVERRLDSRRRNRVRRGVTRLARHLTPRAIPIRLGSGRQAGAAPRAAVRSSQLDQACRHTRDLVWRGAVVKETAARRTDGHARPLGSPL